VTDDIEEAVMGEAERAAARQRIPGLVRELETAAPEVWRREPKERRQRSYEALARHSDPVLREIGQQLAEGRMRPADLLRSPVYLDAFHAAARRVAKRLDPVAVAGELEDLIAARRSPGGRR
jgi:hypothetical protein